MTEDNRPAALERLDPPTKGGKVDEDNAPQSLPQAPILAEGLTVEYTLDQAAALVAERRRWRRKPTSDQLERGWGTFIEECEQGYPMGIYEYANDRFVRTMIHLMLTVDGLVVSPSVEAYKERIGVLDMRFRELLQPGIEIGDASQHWWERGVPKYGGAELSDDFMRTYQVKVTVVPGVD